jgi:integral membrane protein (TIGR01906 family)
VRSLRIGASVVVAALVFPLLVTTSLRIVLDDWIVHFEYHLGHVPDDAYGLDRDARTSLALTGLDAISPGTAGVALLEDARLPDGEPAFTEREIVHMQDVRDLVGALLTFQLWATIALVVSALAFAVRPATRGIVPRGLRWGVLASIGAAAVIGLFMLVAWESFFTRFHEAFFEGDTWRFPLTDTLIRLYPDEFWMGVAAWIAVLTVALAALAWVLAGFWLRQAERRDERTAG